MDLKPLGTLTYLYLGAADFEAALIYYQDVLEARLLWNFAKFGARVAAFKVGEGPDILIADHRPTPSCMLVYAVEDLEETIETLKQRGWHPEEGPFEIPNGPCYTFQDPNGNPFAIFQNDRPDPFGQE